MFGLWHIIVGLLILSVCTGLSEKYFEALKINQLCYFEPLVFLEQAPLNDAAAVCSANGFTLTSVPDFGQFATAISTILLDNLGACFVGTSTTTVIAMPSCSTFDVVALTGGPATDCFAPVNVMCVLPPPPLLPQTVTISATSLTITVTSLTATTVQSTSTVLFQSTSTSFILVPSVSTTIVTVATTRTVSVISTLSTTTTSTVQSTVINSTVSGTTTSTTLTNYSISKTTSSSTLTITKTITEFTTGTTALTTSFCPPTSYSTRTQTTTVTATVTVKTIIPTDTTSLVTGSTTVTTTESVCGGPPTSTACCPPGKKCPRLPKQCLSYGQVQTCKYHDRKLLVAFKPASRDEAACVCQAVGGSLAVLSGEEDLQAAFEVVFGCVGSGGRAWIGQQLDPQHPKNNYLGVDDQDWESESDKCHVVRAIDRGFGVVEDEPCKSKYPILCRYW